MMTEPNKFFSEDTFSTIDETLENNLAYLEDSITQKVKLEYLLDNWDSCHNKEGLTIDPPDNIKWDTAYLDGDFVNSVKYPNDKLDH